MTEFKIPEEAKRTKFIDIRYNNQVRKKTKASILKLSLSIRTNKHTMESLILAQDER